MRDEFLEQKELTRKKDGTQLDADTVRGYRNVLGEFLSLIKATYPADVTAMELRRWMKALTDRRGLSHRSVCNYYISIVAFLHFCDVDHKKLLPYGERPTPDDGEPESYTEDEVRQFLGACENERNRLYFEFLLKTGCREREAAYAEWDDIQRENGGWVFYVHSKEGFRTKTGKGRKVPLEGRLLEQLQLWHKMRAGTRYIFGTDRDRPEGHFLRACKEVAQKAGFDPANFWLHKFRSTFCTWALRRGVDIRTVQHWAGHSSIAITECYLAPDRHLATEKINGVFANV